MAPSVAAIVDRFPCTVERRDFVPIRLADGTRIAATIWLPEGADATPVPAIVEMIPYRRRDGTIFRDWPMQPYVAGHGFAYVRVDLRGAGDSDGLLTDEYTAQEQDDAVEIIAWLARQNWCSGSVGMTGISWGGFNALQVAARRPPALKAIITLCSTDDRYADDVHYMGGCLLTEDAMWSSYMLALNALPPDPQVVGPGWREMWQKRLEANFCWSERWLEHQRRDDYWKHGSVAEDFGAIEIPVYAVGGWEDSYTNAVPRLLAGLGAPRKGLIGPWSHQFPSSAVPGPAIGYLQESIRWWSHWLKGEDTGIMGEPMLRAWINEPHAPLPAYATHPGRWVTEPAWPSPRIAERILFLNDGRLGETAVSGPALTLRSPVTAGRDCGRWGGYGGDCPDNAIDQRREDGQGLCFDTAPLEEDLELLGAPVLELEGIADAPRLNLAVRLTDVAPDGTSTLITWGILNLTHRNGHARPEPLVPGETFAARIQLNDTGRRIAKGSRLRVALATHHWPIVWPQPGDGTLTIVPGAARIRLPARPPQPEDAAIPPFLPAETAHGVSCFEERRPRNERRVVEDVAAGTQAIELSSDYGRYRLDEFNIVTDSWCKDTLSIRQGDPLSARLDAHWFIGFVGGGADVEVRSRVTITADADAFELVWRVQASEGGRLVHERSNRKRVKRDLV